MRALVTLLALVVILGIVAVATGFVNLSGQSGAMPKLVGGSMPTVKADVGSIDLGKKETTVDVPKVDVGSTKKTVAVPTLDVKKPN